MNMSGKRIRSMKREVREKLFDLQKKYIKLETKLMFETDSNTKRVFRDQLKQLDKKRWEILHNND